MEFSCERCGYKSAHKQCVINHLKRITRCNATLEDIDPKILIEKLQNKKYNDKTYDCKYCKRKFNTCSSRARHYKVCKNKKLTECENIYLTNQVKNNKKSVLDVYNENISSLQQIIIDKDNIIKALNKRIEKLEFNIQLMKTSRHEIFYQNIIEKFLNGTHKTLECGITDVTNDVCHAEIKKVHLYKDAIGQLVVYNQEDPRENLHLYLFGKLSNKMKRIIKKACKNLNVHAFYFLDEVNNVKILNMNDETVIYNHSEIESNV